jgi:hypothetical protein
MRPGYGSWHSSPTSYVTVSLDPGCSDGFGVPTPPSASLQSSCSAIRSSTRGCWRRRPLRERWSRDVVIAFRHASYDSPWWPVPSSRPGRFHRARIEVAQYLCLHPMGPAAEMLRNQVGPAGDPDELLLNLWAGDVDLDGIAEVSFDNCSGFGISPEDLVGDRYGPTQDLASRLRIEGWAGLLVPSAALPGTETLVLFGPRVWHPFLLPILSPEEIPTAHVTDAARSPAEVAAYVRWRGTAHLALDVWKATQRYEPFVDELATRW